MSNIDEKAKNNFTTIEMRIFENYEKIIKVIDFLRHAETNLGKGRIKEILFCSMNARDVLFSGFLCVVSWYALNVCVGNFCV